MWSIFSSLSPFLAFYVHVYQQIERFSLQNIKKINDIVTKESYSPRYQTVKQIVPSIMHVAGMIFNLIIERKKRKSPYILSKLAPNNHRFVRCILQVLDHHSNTVCHVHLNRSIRRYFAFNFNWTND